MENTLGQSAQQILMVIAAFYGIWAASGLVNLYLRYHDRLSIDREDVQAMARRAGIALLLAGGMYLYELLPFFAATGFVLAAVVSYQLVRVNTLIKLIERLPKKTQAIEMNFYNHTDNQTSTEA